uniref:Putative secreted protein n=1 Tax=Ixodes ricinus TaxID=34613 RepID=A0A6B0TSY0_IXORI
MPRITPSVLLSSPVFVVVFVCMLRKMNAGVSSGSTNASLTKRPTFLSLLSHLTLGYPNACRREIDFG